MKKISDIFTELFINPCHNLMQSHVTPRCEEKILQEHDEDYPSGIKTEQKQRRDMLQKFVNTIRNGTEDIDE